MKSRLALYLALSLTLVACADKLFDDETPTAIEGDGMGFSPNVVEQADITYDYGQTRSDGTTPQRANGHYAPLPLIGGDSLFLHRMELPLVGIHRKAVSSHNGQGVTRAMEDDIVTTVEDFHDSLTIWGFTDTGRKLFDQTLLKKVRGWRSSVHWPYDAAGMRFYAIAPAMESVEDLLLSNSPDYGTLPTFSYTVPQAPAEQRDLLFGQSVITDVQAGPANANVVYVDADTEKEQHLGLDDKIIPLTFNHILTAVRFAQGKMPVGVTITQIELYHIVNQGEYNPTDNTWTTTVAATDEVHLDTYTITTDKTITTWNAENNYIDGGQVLFLMPHTLTDNAELHVMLTDADGKERIIKTPAGAMAGDQWLPGHTVTYKITIGELQGDYYLLVEPNSNYTTATAVSDPDNVTKYKEGSKAWEHTAGGDNGSFTIHSYRNFTDISASTGSEPTTVNKHHAVDWTVTGFYTPTGESLSDDPEYSLANLPSWLTSISGCTISAGVAASKTEDGSDNQQAATVSYSLAAQEATQQNHQTILAANDRASDVDLSRNTSTNNVTTANCYIVNALGTYTFPLVYGNAYEDGTLKTWAEDTGGTLNPGKIFIDHAGNTIKHANIFDQINSVPDKEYTTGHGEKVTDNDTRLTFLTVEQKQYEDNPTSTTVGPTVEITDGTSTTDGNTTTTNVTETTTTVTTTVTKHYDVYLVSEAYSYKNANLGASIVWQDVVDMIGTPSVYGTPSAGVSANIRFNFSGQSIQPGNCIIALTGRKTTLKNYNVYEVTTTTTETTTRVRTRTKTETTTEGTTTTTYSEWSTPTESITTTSSSTEKLVTGAKSQTTETADAETLWTWHIWVTDEVYPNKGNVDQYYPSYYNGTKIVEVENYSGVKRNMLPVNLGWVPTELTWNAYKPREVWVEIAQTKPNTTDYSQNEKIHLKLRQEAKQQCVTGTGTYYQWGRPSPINTASPSLQPALSGSYWSDTKTLYDPCPPGYQLPPAAVFTGFSLTGADTTDGTKLNMWDGQGEAGKGGYFYATKHNATDGIPAADRYTQQVYIPVTGYWDSTSKQSATTGYYWTTTDGGVSVQTVPVKGSGGSIDFDATTPDGSNALPIRPVQQQ